MLNLLINNVSYNNDPSNEGDEQKIDKKIALRRHERPFVHCVRYKAEGENNTIFHGT